MQPTVVGSCPMQLAMNRRVSPLGVNGAQHSSCFVAPKQACSAQHNTPHWKQQPNRKTFAASNVGQFSIRRCHRFSLIRCTVFHKTGSMRRRLTSQAKPAAAASMEEDAAPQGKPEVAKPSSEACAKQPKTEDPPPEQSQPQEVSLPLPSFLSPCPCRSSSLPMPLPLFLSMCLVWTSGLHKICSSCLPKCQSRREAALRQLRHPSVHPPKPQ